MRIEARNVVVGYGPHDILHDVSLQLRPGEFLGLIGPNGAGKSTLMRALSRVLEVRKGQVLLDGQPIQQLTARQVALKIAFVPQSEPTLFEFTVREVVQMGRHPHVGGGKEDGRADLDAVVRAMAATDTLHLAERPITAISGGEHRRVLIARALAQSTPNLLLDEPTAHLDMTHQAEVLSLLGHLAAKGKVSIIAALHDLNLAAEFCNRLVLLGGGRVVADGPPESVLTTEILSRVYGSSVRLGKSPLSGRPFIYPTATNVPIDPAGQLRIHVVCGGGSGLAILSGLLRKGYLVTAGVLNRLDSDQEAASALGIEHAKEAPFSPISAEARTSAEYMMSQADAIVVAPLPIGRGNLANVELAHNAQASGKRVFILEYNSASSRDFTGGAAGILLAEMVQCGASLVADIQELENMLDNMSANSVCQ